MVIIESSQPGPGSHRNASSSRFGFSSQTTKGLAQLTKTYKMAQDNVHRLQDTFLEHLQRKRTPVTIFLANGVRLQGIVVGYDAFCVLLDCNGHQQIVYKHAVTTTVPAAAVDLQDKSGPVEIIRAAKPALIVERRRSRFAR